MDDELKSILAKIAETIRHLSMDAVQKANSGHPGLPLGCAEIGAYLYAHGLVHNPKNPYWINRDRFILSAGHGSMLLYSCLHLAGYEISLDDIKNFRALHSSTPGHPELDVQRGIEATTGPLGQGIGNAVGLAIAYKILTQKFNKPEYQLFTNKIFTLAGDGCMMEGVSAEASSLAGHLCLDNLVIIYDSNNICLDGPTAETFTEDVKQRYLAYGFEVYEIDGHDLDAIDSVMTGLRKNQKKPALIVSHTTIGKGSPNKSGSHKAHGSPLGEIEVGLAKEALGLPNEDFYVSKQVISFFDKRKQKQIEIESLWNELFYAWGKAYPSFLQEYEAMKCHGVTNSLEEKIANLDLSVSISGRAASNKVINVIAKELTGLYGGSADLSSSDMTTIKDCDTIKKGDFSGRNIKYGVREFAMGTITNGLSLSSMIIPFAGTFLAFSDYMKGAIRLAALSKLKVIYQFTHDSIFIGEDGPTHQPIEQLASLRALPCLQVIRPADGYEVKMAWLAALKYDGPTALILSRQTLADIPSTHIPYESGMGRGAYILKKEKNQPDFTIFATGSEVQLALEVADRLEGLEKDVRVVSIPCFEIFEGQPIEYKNSIVGGELGKRISIEAASEMGWYRYIGRDGIAISVDDFGTSAPPQDISLEYGFTPDLIVQRIMLVSAK